MRATSPDGVLTVAATRSDRGPLVAVEGSARWVHDGDVEADLRQAESEAAGASAHVERRARGESSRTIAT